MDPACPSVAFLSAIALAMAEAKAGHQLLVFRFLCDTLKIIMGIFLLSIILVFALLLLLGYAILWSGLRIFKIASVTRGKIIQYVFISAIATTIFQYLYSAIIYVRLMPYVENLAESIGSVAVTIFINLPMLASSLVITYLLLRYLLQLSGKQLWKLTAYIVLMGFVASAILWAITNAIYS